MNIRIIASLLLGLVIVIVLACVPLSRPQNRPKNRQRYRTDHRISETFPSLESFFDHGVWICSSEDFDDNVLQFYREGKIKITYSIMGQMGRDCQRVESDNLQISDYSPHVVKIEPATLPAQARRELTDPEIGIYSYFWYMHSHAIEPNQSSGDDAWLCPTQEDASNLGQDIGYYSWKIKMTPALNDPALVQLAAENSCGVARLGSLWPVEIAEPESCGDIYDYCYAIKVADKDRNGWMPLDSLYLDYAHKHRVSHR